MQAPARSNEQLSALVEARQWKQALSFCEKKLKKGDQSDGLAVARVSILFSFPDQARQQQGRQELDTLLQRIPPISDIQAVADLDSICYDNAPDSPAFQQLWERAAATMPQDENFLSLWYRQKFHRCDFRGARKACTVWMKNFPNKRNPFFLYIMMTYLVSTLPPIQDNENQLLESLSFKFLSKAAADVSDDSNIMSPGRALNTSEDVQLLFRVYKAQSKYEQAIAIVANPRAGLKAVSKSWEITANLIELYSLAHKWQDQWDHCHDILNHAHNDHVRRLFNGRNDFGTLGDDWGVWEALLIACENIGTKEIVAHTEKVVTAFSKKVPYSRNARTALLKFYSLESAAEVHGKMKLLDACCEYYTTYSTKGTCFQDLRPYVACLDKQNQEEFLSHTSLRPTVFDTATQSLTSEVNSLKLQYYLYVSREDNPNQKEAMLAFVSACIQLYKHSLKTNLQLPASDRPPGDDAAILAAMTLVRLFNMGHHNAILRSVVVLETLVSHSRHNYDALLILVRLYVFLGAGSLAMERYSRLSIKNMQHANLSWIMYTRISTIHPYAAKFPAADGKGQVSIDPLVAMNKAMAWFVHALQLNGKAMYQAQEGGQWTMSLDALSTQDSIEEGSARLVLLIEARRIKRFSLSSQVVQKNEGVAPPRCSKDTRDRTAFPNYESLAQPTFEELLPVAGPRFYPNDKWVEQQLLIARFWDLLHNDGYSPINEEELNKMREYNVSKPHVATDEETEALNMIHILFEVWVTYHQDSLQYEPEAIEECIRKMIIVLETTITDHTRMLELKIQNGKISSRQIAPGFEIPLWRVYHTQYLYLEICLFTVTTMDRIIYANRRRELINHSWLESKTVALQKACKGLVGQVWKMAANLRTDIRGKNFKDLFLNEVLGRNEDNDIGKALSDLDEKGVAATCNMIGNSWIDAFDGVIRTKVA